MPRKWFRPGRKSLEAPVTLIGQFWLANFAGDTDRTSYLLNQLSGQAGGPESAFLQAAAELAAPRYFGPDYDVRAVTSLAAESQKYTKMSKLEDLGLLETEAVFRSALGEDNIDLSGIKLVDVDKMRGYLVGLIVLKQGWSETEIRDLMVEAEQLTLERGWHPPLAADVLDPD